MSEQAVIDARKDVCPVPIVKAKNAIRDLGGPGELVILAGNVISAQNLHKFGAQNGYGVRTEQTGDEEWKITLTIPEEAGQAGREAEKAARAAAQNQPLPEKMTAEDAAACMPVLLTAAKGTVAAVGSSFMGTGDDRLGRNLMKSFLFALSQQDTLPETILFYNGGAYLTCAGSDSLEDLRQMEAAGVNILTCGTCLDFYGIRDQLQVGGITNMYEIVRIQMEAGRVIRP